MKGNLLQGTARGRMGEIVAKVIHGEQVLSKYQPNVTNPKSPKQQEVRRKFKTISQAMKAIRNDLFLLNIKPTYNHYSGASKRLQNVIFPYAFLHSEIQDAEGNNIELSSIKPTIGKGYIGNNLPIYKDELDLYIGDAIAMGTGYFGSEKLIPEGSWTALSFGSTTNSNLPTLRVSKIEELPELVDNTDALGERRQIGIHPSVEECGDWPYIYKLPAPMALGAFCQPIPLNAGQNQIGTGIIVYDALGGIILSDYYYEKVGVTP